MIPVQQECRHSSAVYLNASDFLTWCADRFVYVYGESPNVDFVDHLRRLSKWMKQLGEDRKEVNTHGRDD